MRAVKIWMRVVGVLYLVLALPNLMLIVDPAGGLASRFPDLGLAPASQLGVVFADTWVMYGLELAVIGIALLVFSRVPTSSLALVWTVIALDVVRGVADDLYDIVRGEPAGFYIAFIVLHLIVVVTGITVVRRTRSAEGPRLEEGVLA